ncbi:MAG: hypothetical protein NVS9B2_23320 [Steroidobacteraceae bacterium]
MRCFASLAALVSLGWALFSGVAQGLSLQDPVADAATPQIIYVARRKWHIDVGFDVSELIAPLAALSSQIPGSRYLFFGFGDARYLKAPHRNLPVLLGALWPGRGLLLTTGLPDAPDLAFGPDQVIALSVPAEQARDAQDFVWRSLNLDPPSPGPYAGSLYFSAKPRYSALYTCNTWAAEVLAAAMLPVRARSVIFAGQLWSQVRRLQKQQATPEAVLSRADSSRSRRPLSLTSSAARPP